MQERFDERNQLVGQLVSNCVAFDVNAVSCSQILRCDVRQRGGLPWDGDGKEVRGRLACGSSHPGHLLRQKWSEFTSLTLGPFPFSVRIYQHGEPEREKKDVESERVGGDSPILFRWLSSSPSPRLPKWLSGKWMWSTERCPRLARSGCPSSTPCGSYFGFPNEDRSGTEGTGPFGRTSVLVLRRSWGWGGL